MMTFNSQICTSREQSKRLLELGLKKGTADMTWEFSHTKNGEPQYDCRAESSWDSETFARYVEHCEKMGYFEHWKHEDGSQMTPEEVYDEIMKIHFPAWSLHRLIEMMPISLPCEKMQGLEGIFSITCHQDKTFTIGYVWSMEKCGDLYDAMVDAIEWLIKEGYFNKKYLCEK